MKRMILAGVALLATAAAVQAFIFDLSLVRGLHSAAAEHADQAELYDLVASGQDEEAFEAAFEEGDELFEFAFNALDGAGANVGQGQRFTRIPRADLNGGGQWARHVPARTTGPNAQSCRECHNQPFDDGAGGVSANVHRDPFHEGVLGKFLQRNPPHTFASGAIQVLAEEMTEQIHAIREEAKSLSCQTGQSVTRTLSAKGVAFGTIKVTRTVAQPCNVTVHTTGVQGVDPDLVVRPFQWKGSLAFLRDVSRAEAHNQLGMQAVELVGDGEDGDGDTVADELTIGDQTALAIYLAAQPRPTTKLELSSLGLIPPLPPSAQEAILRGSALFDRLGCASCHRPALTLDDPIFKEPSQNPSYRDATFPGGQDPIAHRVDPAFAVSFDLTEDQPDNQIVDENGNLVRLGSLRKNAQGRALVELYGDLKRHAMGAGLAEGVDEVGTGAATFLTRNLWGVGSTAPYLHDGRATTLTEAILEHGGEAAPSRVSFQTLPLEPRRDLIAFLDNLVLFKVEGEAQP